MKIKNNISVSESGFVFDAKTGESYSLNPSGKEIIRLLNLGKTQEEIKEYMLARYDVPDLIVIRHLDDFFQMLSYFNLTVECHDQ